MPQILYTEEANKKWYISYKGGNIIQYRTYNSDLIIPRCTNYLILYSSVEEQDLPPPKYAPLTCRLIYTDILKKQKNQEGFLDTSTLNCLK